MAYIPLSPSVAHRRIVAVRICAREGCGNAFAVCASTRHKRFCVWACGSTADTYRSPSWHEGRRIGGQRSGEQRRAQRAAKEREAVAGVVAVTLPALRDALPAEEARILARALALVHRRAYKAGWHLGYDHGYKAGKKERAAAA